MSPHLDTTLPPLRYFSRRSYMPPPPSALPALILAVLTVLAVVGLFADIARS